MQRLTASQSPGRAVHPAHPSNIWSHESLFNRISRNAMYRPVNATHATDLLRKAWGVQNPLQAYVGHGNERQSEYIEQLLALVGCDNASDLRRLTGTDLLAKEDRELANRAEKHRVFSSTLRYCKACMHLGFHSMLFQHLGVSRCPLHGVALLSSCTGCGHEIQPTASGILINPYACARCQQLLVKTVATSDGLQQVKLINGLVGDWRRDLMVQFDHPRIRVPIASLDLPERRPDTSEAQRKRHLQRATAWPSSPTSRWTRFKEEAQLLHPTLAPPNRIWDTARFRRSGFRPTDTLLWLSQECEAPRAESFELFAGSWTRIQFITPDYQNQQLSVLAVALHLTMSAYAVQRVTIQTAATVPTTKTPYVGATWNGAHSGSTPDSYGALSDELISMEILGYFAMSVLRCAGRLNPMVPGAQAREAPASFSACSFCPTWQLSKEGTEWTMRMRTRASREFIQRLIRRYRSKPLRCMVVCSASTRRTMPDVRDFGRAKVPKELLHFPAGVPCSP